MAKTQFVFSQPNFGTIVREASHRTTTIEKPNVFVVRDRREHGRVAKTASQFHRLCAGQFDGPQHFASFGVQTVSDDLATDKTFFKCLDRFVDRRKHFVAPDGDGRLARFGQWSSPSDVFITHDRPFRRRFAFGLKVNARSSRLRPVLGKCDRRQ